MVHSYVYGAVNKDKSREINYNSFSIVMVPIIQWSHHRPLKHSTLTVEGNFPPTVYTPNTLQIETLDLLYGKLNVLCIVLHAVA